MMGLASGRIRMKVDWDPPVRRDMDGGVFRLPGGNEFDRVFPIIPFWEGWVSLLSLDHLHTRRLRFRRSLGLRA